MKMSKLFSEIVTICLNKDIPFLLKEFSCGYSIVSTPKYSWEIDDREEKCCLYLNHNLIYEGTNAQALVYGIETILQSE